MSTLPARGCKVLIAVALLFCLTPGADEALEQVAHFATTGHLAHLTEGETDLGGDADEHGCRPSAHVCGCCASVPVVTSVPVPWAGVQALAMVVRWGASMPPRDRAQDEVFRPPISA